MMDIPPLPDVGITAKEKHKIYTARHRARRKALDVTPAEQLVESVFKAGKAAGK